MKSIDEFQSLTNRAQLDIPQAVNVTDKVLSQIREQQAANEPASSWLLYSFTATAVATAIGVGINNLNLYQQVSDPFVGFLVDMSRIMQ